MDRYLRQAVDRNLLPCFRSVRMQCDTVGASHVAVRTKQRHTKSHPVFSDSAPYRPGVMVCAQLSAGPLRL